MECRRSHGSSAASCAFSSRRAAGDSNPSHREAAHARRFRGDASHSRGIRAHVESYGLHCAGTRRWRAAHAGHRRLSGLRRAQSLRRLHLLGQGAGQNPRPHDSPRGHLLRRFGRDHDRYLQRCAPRLCLRRQSAGHSMGRTMDRGLDWQRAPRRLQRFRQFLRYGLEL